MYQEGITTQEIADRIIASLTEKKYQTLRHLAINTGLLPDDVELFLYRRTDICSSVDVEFLRIYFLCENAPVGRLVNTGENYFTDEGNPAPVVKRKRRTKSAIAILPKKRKLGEIQTKLDSADLELLGYQGKTVKEISVMLEIPESSAVFYLYSKLYPRFGAAYQKGKALRREQEKSS